SVVTHPAYPQTDVHVRKFNREVEIMPESLETAEAIAEAMDAIVDGAEGRSLSEDEQAKYTELEKKLELIRKSEEIRSRHEAARKVERPVVARNEDVKPEENEFRNYLVAPETRGQVIGTPSAGGYTVLETWANELIRVVESYGGLAGVVRNVSTSAGEPLHYPSLALDQNKAEIVDEATGPVSGADLVFDQVVLNAYSYQSNGANGEPFRVTRELLQDSKFDIAGEISRAAGERIARALADDLVAGDGTSPPEGITASTGPSATFAGDALTYEELVDAVHKIDPAYRRNGVWVFNDSTLAAIRKLTDTNGRPLLEGSHEGIASGFSATLLGYPVVVDQAFEDFGNGVFGVFGDLKEGYVLRNVKGVELLADPYSAMNTREILYTAWARFDGKIRNPYAFTLLTSEAAGS